MYAGVVVNKERPRKITFSPFSFTYLCRRILFKSILRKIIFIHCWLILDLWVFGCGSHHTFIHCACNQRPARLSEWMFTLGLSEVKGKWLSTSGGGANRLSLGVRQRVPHNSMPDHFSKVTAFIRRRDKHTFALS